MLLPAATVMTLMKWAALLEYVLKNVNTPWALMAFKVPAVAPSAPFTHAQNEKPAKGVADVPIMFSRFQPEPTVTVKLLVVPVEGATPANPVPAFEKYTAPAPAYGSPPVAIS
jgi:hypothetical protein